MADNAAHLRSADGSVQPIRAKQQHIAGQHVVVAGLHTDEQIRAQRAAEHMAGGYRGCFLGRKDPQTCLLTRYRVIARERHGAAAAHKIAARISHVGNHRPIKAEGAGDECGCHPGASGAGSQCSLVYLCVGCLYQARQEG